MTLGLLDRPTEKRRSDGIDLVRVALALWVIVTHLAEWGPLTGTGIASSLRAFDSFSEHLFQGDGETHPAVVAFIVLSGYCIHRNGGRRGTWSPRAYAVKRALRIAPVYVVASLLGAALFALAWRANSHAAELASGTGQITLGGMLEKLSTISAVVPIQDMATNPHNTYQGNGPLYTVAAEMWLYAFYAGAMTLLIRRRISERGLAVGIVLLAGAGVAAWSTSGYRDWWYNASFVAFLPLWWIGASAVGTAPNRRMIAVAAVLWLTATVYLRQHAGFAIEEARLLAFGVLAAGAIRTLDARVSSVRATSNAFGRGGYSLYAFHAPVLILLVSLGVAWPIVALAAASVGLLMFQVLEQPTTRYGRELAKLQRPVGHAADAPDVKRRHVPVDT